MDINIRVACTYEYWHCWSGVLGVNPTEHIIKSGLNVDETWYYILLMNFQVSMHDGGDGELILYSK